MNLFFLAFYFFRFSRLVPSICLALLLSACATDPQALSKDPFESTNRHVFGFNEGLDEKVLKPSAKVYDTLIPKPVQNAVDNFTNNIKDVWSLTNLILQGEGDSAIYELMRIGVNTTLGLAGFVDMASDLRLDRHNEDLGQTLAVWGVKNGPYLVLPVFGPSTARDAAALPFDQYVMPVNLFHEVRDINAVRALQLLNTRAKLLVAGDLLNDVALDKYTFVRDAYLQRRRNLIYNGDPPDDESIDNAWHQPPRSSPLFASGIVVPDGLSQRMFVQVDTSIFFDGIDENTQAQDLAASFAQSIARPPLPNSMVWETVSTH